MSKPVVKKDQSAPAGWLQKINNVTTQLSRIKFTEKLFFVDHLRTMVKAGLSLIEALDILSKEMESKKFKAIIGRIKQEVEKGRALSEVLAEHSKVFPSIYVKMIASGEMSGKLEESLEQVVTQMSKTQKLMSSIKGAMIYPAVILVAMSGVGIMMATVVLPKIMEMFKEFDAELPLMTRLLIGIINFISNPLYLALVLFSIFFVIALFIFLMKRATDFRRLVHSLNLKLPIIGPVIKQINLAKFSLTLSSLLKSTIPIIEAVEIASGTCTNMNYQESLQETAKLIKTGEPLSTILHGYPKLFPPMVTEMIMVGERTGQVEHLLNELSDYYGEEVDKTMKNFSTIIEPVIIIVLGLAVAVFAVAVIMPMYSLAQDF
jgi:type IV pilus assembly protein PilC